MEQAGDLFKKKTQQTNIYEGAVQAGDGVEKREESLNYIRECSIIQCGVIFIDTNNISSIFLQKNIYLNLKIFKVLFSLILMATLQALLQLRESSSVGDTRHETRTQNSQIFPPFKPSVLYMASLPFSTSKFINF